MKTKIVLIIAVLMPFILLSKIMFPLDVLNYLPSYTLEKWDKPHNSLLADPIFQFEPWRYFAKEKILHGEIPLWNNLNGAGAPFLANPQVAIFSPFNLLYYLLPINLSLLLTPLIKISLFSLFTYLYLKAIKVKTISAILGALVVSTSGFFLVWVLWPHTNVYLLLPLMLFLIEKSKRENKVTLWFPVSYTMAIFGGHPETLFHISVFIAIYALVRLGFGKKLFLLFLYFAMSFGIAAFQLIPFFEYLLNSYALDKRVSETMQFYLPLKGMIINLIPFIQGAPHTQFYKSFTASTNFQESIGGYVGIICILFVVFYYRKIKQPIATFWLYAAILSVPIAFNIFPFNLLKLIPLLKVSADHRVIAFTGFSLATLFALSFDTFLKKTGVVDKIAPKSTRWFILFSTVLLLLGILMVKVLFRGKVELFGGYLVTHFFIIIASSILFFYYSLLYKKHSEKKVGAILCVFLFIQTGLLFVSYNPLVNSNLYYPKNELVKALIGNKEGRVVEVGNHNLPPNINLIYGIEQAENDDAMEINAYKVKFNQEFPIKNHLGNVDEASVLSLQKMGIRYVASDYDLNSLKQKVQIKLKDRIDVDNLPKIIIPFKAEETQLIGVRVITANYNRLNNCFVEFEILDKETSSLAGKSSLDCSDARDGMFYMVPFDATLVKGRDYMVKVYSNNAGNDNFIALQSYNFKPFMEILYKKENGFSKIWNKKSIYLYEVPNVNIIEGVRDYEVIENSQSVFSFTYNSERNKEITIKKTLYSGWNVEVDSKKIDVSGSPFFVFNVPEGSHFVRLTYKPASLYIGGFISFISLIIYLFIILRNSKQLIIGFISKSFEFKKLNSIEVIKLFSLSLAISLFSIITLMLLIPVKFNPPKSTAINWYTVNNYPRQQDQFYVFFGVVGILLISAIIMFVFFRRLKK